MLARLPRPLAIMFALLLAAGCAWCLAVTPPPIKTAKKGGYTDVRLYHDITAQVALGKPYHLAAAQLHRAHHYPLRPFFTMRLPTLGVLAAQIGWKGVQKICTAAALLGIFAWFMALDGLVTLPERVLAGIAVAAGSGPVVNAGLMALHEYPSGFFLSLALAGAIGWPHRWWALALPAAAAIAFRELALPFVLLALAFALWEKRGKEAAGWVALLAAFGIGMAFHAMAARAVVLPSDIPSPGWHDAQGFSAFLKAVVFTSILQPLKLPFALLAAMLPLVGWCALTGRAGAFAMLFFVGYAVMIAAFSRPDTFYWGAIVMPHYFVGFALLPRALWQLAGAIRGRMVLAG